MSIELVNPDIDRVDAVNGPATGIPFLLFKSAEGGPAAEEAPAEPVEKAADADEDAEDLAEEAADADAANVDGSPVSDDAALSADPGDAAWEAVDAAKARVASKGLAVIESLLQELAAREDAEGGYTGDAFDLMDAGEAVRYALGVLARFAVTEQLDADNTESVAKALEALKKSLHLTVHDKDPEAPEADGAGDVPAAPGVPAGEAGEPAAHEANPAPAPETPVEDSLTPPAPAAPAPAPAAPAKGEGLMPSGLQEILDTFVAGYQQWKEGEKSGAAEDVHAPAPAAPAAAPAPAAAHPAPAAPHAEPAAAPPAHAEAPKAPEAGHAPAEPGEADSAAPAEAPAAEAPAPEAPATGDEDKPVKKSMEDLIAEAVAKATEPLLKQIDVLERTPVDDGPLLAGQTPANAGIASLRGQDGGVAPEGLMKSGAAQSPSGMDALAAGLKSTWGL